MIGGFVSGALTGLAADIASGGLTFGAGLLAGGIVGAVGRAGVARGFNLVRGKTESTIRWSDEFIATLVPAAVLRYLAVAHYGRGRGEWAASEYPPFWRDAVLAAIQRAGGVAPILALRGTENCNVQTLASAWQANWARFRSRCWQRSTPTPCLPRDDRRTMVSRSADGWDRVRLYTTNDPHVRQSGIRLAHSLRVASRKDA